MSDFNSTDEAIEEAAEETMVDDPAKNKLGTQSVLRLILTMSPPAMLSMFITAMYNVVDSYYVAKVSDDALAAVSLAAPINFLMGAFCVGTGVGIASVISRRLGQKRVHDANSTATHGLILALISALAFAVFGIVGSRAFISVFTDAPQILAMGDSYLSICCIFCFGIFIQVTCEKILQSTGNMIMPMIVHIIGAVINIVLDPLFIFGFWFIPAMGVTGAAIATVIGQIAAMIIILCVLLFRSHKIKITFKGFRFHGKIIKDIYSVAFPTIVMQSIGSFLTMIMNGILAGFGTAAYTVYGLYFRLQSFIFMPIFGMNQGLMPIIGFNYGARNKKRITDALKYAVIFDFIFSLVGMALFVFFPEQLLRIFTDSPEIIEIGTQALRTISLIFTPAAMSIVLSTVFQAVGKGFYSLLNSLMRQLLLILPLAYIFSTIGLHMVWWAFPIAEVFSVALSIFLFVRLYRKEIRHLETAKIR